MQACNPCKRLLTPLYTIKILSIVISLEVFKVTKVCTSKFPATDGKISSIFCTLKSGSYDSHWKSIGTYWWYKSNFPWILSSDVMVRISTVSTTAVGRKRGIIIIYESEGLTNYGTVSWVRPHVRMRIYWNFSKIFLSISFDFTLSYSLLKRKVGEK